jgi:hypothetical protein
MRRRGRGGRERTAGGLRWAWASEQPDSTAPGICDVAESPMIGRPGTLVGNFFPGSHFQGHFRHSASATRASYDPICSQEARSASRTG